MELLLSVCGFILIHLRSGVFTRYLWKTLGALWPCISGNDRMELHAMGWREGCMSGDAVNGFSH